MSLGPPYITSVPVAAAFRAACGEAEGALYFYGPAEQPWPPKYADCSYFALRLLQRTGLVGHRVARLRAVGMAGICDPVPLGQQAPGDLWFGGSGGPPGGVAHVCVVTGAPQSSAGGHSEVIGANGGGASVKGDDPTATVAFERAGYWKSGFIVYGRIKASERKITAADIAIAKALAACRAGAAVPAGNLGQVLEKRYAPLLRSWGRS